MVIIMTMVDHAQTSKFFVKAGGNTELCQKFALPQRRCQAQLWDKWTWRSVVKVGELEPLGCHALNGSGIPCLLMLEMDRSGLLRFVFL